MEWWHLTSPSKRKFKMQQSVSKVTCTVFWDRKSVILLVSWNPDKPSTLTATSRRWVSWRPELPVRPDKKKTFLLQHDNTSLIPVWRPCGTLQSLAGLSYQAHHTVWIWHLLTSTCSGRWMMDYVGNIFLTKIPSSQLRERGSPPVVQISTSPAYRLLFITGKNAQPMVPTMWNNSVL